MASAIEKLQTLNSVVRTLMALIVFGAAGTIGWIGYQRYHAADQQLSQAQQALSAKEAALAESLDQLASTRRTVEEQGQQLAVKDAAIAEQQQTIATQIVEIEQLNEDIRQKKAEILRLDTALRLHKMERRLARVSVLDVDKDAETGKTFSTIEFVELNESGDPIGQPRRFKLEGQLIYVDYLVAKFEDKYVEQADLERGTSICLFSRIFGEFQKPNDGFSLDEPGERPGPYERGGVMSDFEKKIWSDFWSIANDPAQAAELGIRTLHGDAVSIKVQKGKTYRITVRSAGGPEILVEEDQPPRDGNSASISRGAPTL
ncbi:MAG: hypothetical protein KJ000_14190 [Pirellulaceae bacterium]|nr:hypothetical protein [Pirellulaceae bacterium]